VVWKVAATPNRNRNKQMVTPNRNYKNPQMKISTELEKIE
jgi:hypothetical protein